jgi:hypothetical protein
LPLAHSSRTRAMPCWSAAPVPERAIWWSPSPAPVSEGPLPYRGRPGQPAGDRSPRRAAGPYRRSAHPARFSHSRRARLFAVRPIRRPTAVPLGQPALRANSIVVSTNLTFAEWNARSGEPNASRVSPARVFARSSARSEEIFRHRAQTGAARITVHVSRRLGDPQRHRAVLKIKRRNEPRDRRRASKADDPVPAGHFSTNSGPICRCAGIHLVAVMANARGELTRSGASQTRRSLGGYYRWLRG